MNRFRRTQSPSPRTTEDRERERAQRAARRLASGRPSFAEDVQRAPDRSAPASVEEPASVPLPRPPTHEPLEPVTAKRSEPAGAGDPPMAPDPMAPDPPLGSRAWDSLAHPPQVSGAGAPPWAAEHPVAPAAPLVPEPPHVPEAAPMPAPLGPAGPRPRLAPTPAPDEPVVFPAPAPPEAPAPLEAPMAADVPAPLETGAPFTASAPVESDPALPYHDHPYEPGPGLPEPHPPWEPSDRDPDPEPDPAPARFPLRRRPKPPPAPLEPAAARRTGRFRRRPGPLVAVGPAAREPSGGRTRRRILATLPLLLAAGAIWFCWMLFQPFHGAGHGRIDVTIPAGTGTSAIGKLLARDGVISSSFFFEVRTLVDGKRGQLRFGHFVLKRDMSYGAAIAALSKRPPVAHVRSVTIPEGSSRREIARLAGADGLQGNYLTASARSRGLDPHRYGARGHPGLEGFLFPSTYQLVAPGTVDKLVADQIAAFKNAFAGVNLSDARRHHLSPYAVLIIASMVERESALARERPLISAVIYNRLRLHMPLGIDATIRYALNNWTSPLTVSELNSSSPYNTRRRLGLPPTPIGNPGVASMHAAAHPARVPFLYFVVRPGTCGHAFSVTYAEAQRNVARYQAARARRHGRSPTRC